MRRSGRDNMRSIVNMEIMAMEITTASMNVAVRVIRLVLRSDTTKVKDTT